MTKLPGLLRIILVVEFGKGIIVFNVQNRFILMKMEYALKLILSVEFLTLI